MSDRDHRSIKSVILSSSSEESRHNAYSSADGNSSDNDLLCNSRRDTCEQRHLNAERSEFAEMCAVSMATGFTTEDNSVDAAEYDGRLCTPLKKPFTGNRTQFDTRSNRRLLFSHEDEFQIDTVEMATSTPAVKRSGWENHKQLCLFGDNDISRFTTSEVDDSTKQNNQSAFDQAEFTRRFESVNLSSSGSPDRALSTSSSEADTKYDKFVRQMHEGVKTSTKPTVARLSDFIVADNESISSHNTSRSQSSREDGRPVAISHLQDIVKDIDALSHSQSDTEESELVERLTEIRLGKIEKPVSRDRTDDHAIFLSSLEDQQSKDPQIQRFWKSFPRTRAGLTKRLTQIFDSEIFDKKLVDVLDLDWTKRLTTTAGRFMRTSSGKYKIELSVKVCDNPVRLRDTLVHEMCHAAVSIIDSVLKAGHGPVWKRWTAKVSRRFPDLPTVTRCHNYRINKKYEYECRGCGQIIGRHSKSLNITANVCGRCRGHFQLRTQCEETPATPLNSFAAFVKHNYRSCKNEPGTPHSVVMKRLADSYRQSRKTTLAENPSEPAVYTIEYQHPAVSESTSVTEESHKQSGASIGSTHVNADSSTEDMNSHFALNDNN